MKLYELSWGLYPRRVSIYLAEKRLTGIERITFDVMTEWPSLVVARLNPFGTVPILETDDGTVIRSSTAILEYLEELHPSPDMLGWTPEDRAGTRALVGAIDEAAMQFATWNRQGSPLFAGRGSQNREAGAFAARAYLDRLAVLDTLLGETGGEFVSGSGPTIADCVLMATLQFADEVYAVPVPEGCPNLSKWYEAFRLRPSAVSPDNPAPIIQISRGLLEHCPPAPRD